ncbi:MAG: LysM peptidoglycan-binding domain-containing protein, partial [Gammaproteobacteria bacterium]
MRNIKYKHRGEMMTAVKKSVIFFIFSLFYAIGGTPAFALTFALPDNGDNVVGEVQYTEALAGDTFSHISRRYNVGYYQLVEANPSINPNKMAEGTLLVIPTAFILPAAPRKGMIINLAELRM